VRQDQEHGGEEPDQEGVAHRPEGETLGQVLRKTNSEDRNPCIPDRTGEDGQMNRRVQDDACKDQRGKGEELHAVIPSLPITSENTIKRVRKTVKGRIKDPNEEEDAHPAQGIAVFHHRPDVFHDLRGEVGNQFPGERFDLSVERVGRAGEKPPDQEKEEKKRDDREDRVERDGRGQNQALILPVAGPDLLDRIPHARKDLHTAALSSRNAIQRPPAWLFLRNTRRIGTPGNPNRLRI
jgi:hypothetical protein